MNAAMKEQHFSRINDERARRVYDYLCASCELREGGLTDADQMLVYDYAYAEQVKQQLEEAKKEREKAIAKAQANTLSHYIVNALQDRRDRKNKEDDN